MGSPPARPKIYHITHGRNLHKIISEGCLWSDAEIIARGGPEAVIGLTEIKRRRLEESNVVCHPGTKVGEFVPLLLLPPLGHALHTAQGEPPRPHLCGRPTSDSPP